MPDLDDGDRRARWIVRLLMVIAAIVGVAAYRDDARDEAHAGQHATRSSARSASAVAVRTAGSGSAERGLVAPAPATQVLRLEGIVVDEDKQPVGGARVSLAGRPDTTTEDDGSFAFDGLAEGDYDLSAEHGEWFVESAGNSLSETSDPVTLELARGPSLAIKVVDEANRPLAGAKVSILSRERLTGPDGRARFRAVALDDEVLIVSLARHASVRERVVTSDDPHETIEKTVVMQGGADISGIVVDAHGVPLEDASVDVEPVGGGRNESVWTDKTGTFHLVDIAKGSYTAKASTKDTIPAEPVSFEHDGEHARTGIKLTVARGGEIGGVVVDSGGHPVAEAHVQGGGSGATSDKDGRFLLTGLLPDKHTVSASTTLLGTADREVTIGRGEHLEIRIVLVPSSLAGIVVDARGEPVEGATVYARSETPDSFGFGMSDEHGRFDLGGLPPSAHYKVTAQREDSRVEGPAVDVPSGNRQLRVTVHDDARITGRVILDGVPVPYFGYAIGEDTDDGYTRITPVRHEDGRFTLKDAAPGKVAVAIVGPTFARKVIRSVVVRSGEVTDLGEIAVERGEVIRGRVVDERGGAIAGATVTLVTRSAYSRGSLERLMQGEVYATSDPTGAYELVGVPAATDERSIKSTHPTRGTSLPTTLPAGQSVTDLVLHATGTISGFVATREGIFAVAQLVDEERSRFYADIDSSGHFSFSGLVPGTYEVDVHARASYPSVKVEVTAGATATISLETPLPAE